jgi:hypothetical protein
VSDTTPDTSATQTGGASALAALAALFQSLRRMDAQPSPPNLSTSGVRHSHFPQRYSAGGCLTHPFPRIPLARSAGGKTGFRALGGASALAALFQSLRRMDAQPSPPNLSTSGVRHSHFPARARHAPSLISRHALLFAGWRQIRCGLHGVRHPRPCQTLTFPSADATDPLARARHAP